MKNSMLWMLLPVTVVMAVIGVFYVLFPERFLIDGTLVVAILLAALAAGALVFNSISDAGRKGGDAGMIGSISLGTIISAIVLIVASTGVALALSGIGKAAMALNIVTLASFVIMFVIIRATGSNLPGGSGRFKSPNTHTDWANRLENIARSCKSPQLKPRLLKLAGETRLLTQDEGFIAQEISQRITSLLDAVAEAVSRGDEQSAMYQLKRLRNLFSERETELMHLKGKA